VAVVAPPAAVRGTVTLQSTSSDGSGSGITAADPRFALAGRSGAPWDDRVLDAELEKSGVRFSIRDRESFDPKSIGYP
jgi:hypothetical protein